MKHNYETVVLPTIRLEESAGIPQGNSNNYMVLKRT